MANSNVVGLSQPEQTQADTQKARQQLPPSPAGFFEEECGSKSSMRLMSMLALLTAITFGTITLLAAAGVLGEPVTADSGQIMIIFGFLVSAFAPKAVQKFAETKVLGG